MRQKTIAAVFNALVGILEAASAVITQGVQRTIAKKAVEAVRIACLMTREIQTCSVCKMIKGIHNLVALHFISVYTGTLTF
jgi:hypothetical protein